MPRRGQDQSDGLIARDRGSACQNLGSKGSPGAPAGGARPAERRDSITKLELTGPAGGSWSPSEGGVQLKMDAIDFCRALSVRGQASGLLAVTVFF